MRRRWLVPEVVQTSAMDCGPAALKALLGGFGVPVSYDRLREACQTDVDGTSIDTLEGVAGQLGLEVEQTMVPVDHLFLDEAGALPALTVVRLPSGLTHFVVLWRHAAGMVQLMDPATGRRWTTARGLRDELYVHQMGVPAEAWREFAGGDAFLAPLRRRLDAVGGAPALVDSALADPSWRGLGALDAAVRMAAALVEAGAVTRGESRTLVEHLFDDGRAGGEAIPAAYWTVRATDDPAEITLRGAVTLCARGVRARPAPGTEESAPLPPELAAALAEPPTRPGRRLFALLREDGLLGPAALTLALAAAALAGLLEAVLFRGLLDVGRQLGVVQQRVGALGGLLALLALLALLEAPIFAGVVRLGRQLEARLRLAFLRKIPRLADRYLHSRPVSDMAERSHAIHEVRQLPLLAAGFVRAGCQLVVSTLGLLWIDPRSAPLALVAAALALLLPLVAQPALSERDLRQRAHAGALGRFYLDALLGLTAVRTHGAERAVRREHEALVVDWARTGRGLLRLTLTVEAAQAAVGFTLAALLLFGAAGRIGEGGSLLLFVYWALELPVVGRELAVLFRQLPTSRNTTLRLLEPLGAREDETHAPAPAPAARPGGASIALAGVQVVAGGHLILDGVDLALAPGEHVAVVGRSGAGKSSLAGLLLGWHRAAAGTLRVDGEELDGARLARLRQETAWVDPEVQLWNRSLLDNLRYGNDGEPLELGPLLAESELRRVLEHLPEGLQTPLGEGGGLVSGGEGQRVRFARALGRRRARLVLLDEAFRGLDGERRRALLARARAWWPEATLVCITHDVGEARGFDRVLVVEAGKIVEDGAPEPLAADAGSRFRALLDAEAEVRARVWGARRWRRLRLGGGRLEEESR